MTVWPQSDGSRHATRRRPDDVNGDGVVVVVVVVVVVAVVLAVLVEAPPACAYIT